MVEAIFGFIGVLLGAGFVGILALVGIGVILALILKGVVSLIKWILGINKRRERS